tara:strand:- start:2481 stop:3347 length:867 start_codon:yes stop_codon:yes gene_type:complete
MAKSKNKNSISSFIKRLNEIDINTLIESLNNIKLEDLKKIDFNDLTKKIKKSDFFKPTIGLFGGSLLFVFLLIPAFEQLIDSFAKSKNYQDQSNSLVSQRLRIKQLEAKIKKSKLLISDINESIISKDDIIFISKLINQTALKSNVNIISIIPVNSARSSKLCREANQSRKSRSSNRITSNKGSFKDNFFEINLLSNYLDLIKFLNNIQYYDVVILPNCLEVIIANTRNEKEMISEDNINNNNSSRIIPLSESGVPLTLDNSGDKLNSNSSFNQVKIRLVLMIPSHSR